MLNENDLWLLSFYRTSEIGGALFFGRLARAMRPGPVQLDMSKHFADESQHAWLWSSCIEALGAKPLKLGATYQDQYVAACGIPANLMEVLAITQIFEQRVTQQYARHLRAPGVHPRIRETLARIMEDERWHISWVRAALSALAPEYGKDRIDATLKRFREADQAVYQKTIEEQRERVGVLFLGNPVTVG
jgi:hypothetical protein